MTPPLHLQPSRQRPGWRTIINSCGWIRGSSSDFDEWVRLVNDAWWGYGGQLPYFRKMGHTFNATTDPLQHSFSGHALRLRQLSRTRLPAPLDDQGREGRRRGGLQRRRERGNPPGLGELNENRRDGLRQLASSAYPLSGVAVLPNTLVASVFLSKINDALTATGVQLSNGTKLYAPHEVLLAAGAYRTP